jgi:hypothetical protein
MASIFISYRRVGALVHARALFERLRSEFGPSEVFIDLEGIDYGVDFVDLLNEQLKGCRVVIALIDPQWSTATDKQGKRRIERESDYVRTEIETALTRGIRTVPVLIDGAEMPDASELPAELRSLTRRNALALDFTRFDAEVGRLVATLRKLLAITESSPTQPLGSSVLHAAEAGVHSAVPESSKPRRRYRLPPNLEIPLVAGYVLITCYLLITSQATIGERYDTIHGSVWFFLYGPLLEFFALYLVILAFKDRLDRVHKAYRARFRFRPPGIVELIGAIAGLYILILATPYLSFGGDKAIEQPVAFGLVCLLFAVMWYLIVAAVWHSGLWLSYLFRGVQPIASPHPLTSSAMGNGNAASKSLAWILGLAVTGVFAGIWFLVAPIVARW